MGGPKLALAHPKINLCVRKCTDEEGLGVRKRINITVKSTIRVQYLWSALYYGYILDDYRYSLL